MDSWRILGDLLLTLIMIILALGYTYFVATMSWNEGYEAGRKSKRGKR